MSRINQIYIGEYEHVYPWWSYPGYKMWMLVSNFLDKDIAKGKASKWYGELFILIRVLMTIAAILIPIGVSIILMELVVLVSILLK